MSSLTRKCIFYGLEHNAKEDSIKLDFEDLKMRK